jgi:8-oxo-dGTP diphosphatase
MSPTPFAVRSRRAVDAILADLEAEFGAFPIVDWADVNDPDYFDHGVDIVEAGVHGGAGARVTNASGEVLLIRESRLPETWVLPGGGHEPGETFPETARREVWEEAGVDCDLTGVWRAVRKRFVHRDDPERRGYLLEVFFTADRVGGEADTYPERWDESQDEEVLEVRWFDGVPENAMRVVGDPTAEPEY